MSASHKPWYSIRPSILILAVILGVTLFGGCLFLLHSTGQEANRIQKEILEENKRHNKEMETPGFRSAPAYNAH